MRLVAINVSHIAGDIPENVCYIYKRALVCESMSAQKYINEPSFVHRHVRVCMWAQCGEITVTRL